MCARRCMRMENLPSSPNNIPLRVKKIFIFQMSRRDFSNGAILVFGARDNILHTWFLSSSFSVSSLFNFELDCTRSSKGHFKVIFRMFATKHRIWQSHRGHYLKSLQRLEVKGQIQNSRRFKSDLIPYDLEIKRLPPSFDISITSQNQNDGQKGRR